MNRRKLLRIISGLSAITLMPKSNFFTGLNPKQLHFVGLGNGGSTALEFIHNCGVKGKYSVINDKPRLSKQIDYIEFIAPKDQMIHENGKAKRVSRMNDELTVSNKMIELFQPDDRYILLAGLGGFTGTKLTVCLYNELKNKEKDFTLICSQPFSFEGSLRKLQSKMVVDALNHQPNFKYFNLQSIREEYGNMTLGDAFQKGDERFYEIFKKSGWKNV